MQGVIAETGKLAVGFDHLGQPRDLARYDDVALGKAQLDGCLSAGHCALDEGLPLDLVCRKGRFLPGIGVHLPGEDLRVQASGVDPYSDGLIKLLGHLYEGPEVLIAAWAAPHVARIDAKLCQGLGAVGVGV